MCTKFGSHPPPCALLKKLDRDRNDARRSHLCVKYISDLLCDPPRDDPDEAGILRRKYIDI